MWLLTDREMKDAYLLGEAKGVAQAQLRKVIKLIQEGGKRAIEEGALGLYISHGGVDFPYALIPKEDWQQLRKEAGNELQG